MNITIKQLRAFITVAKYQNFTAAAQHLHLSQSALSGLIKELENTLGFQVFDRTTRQLNLSQLGEQLLPQAQRIIHELMVFESQITMFNKLEQGQVRIAVSQQFAASMMPMVIANFQKTYPHIQFTLIDCSVEMVLQRVQSMDVDFGLGAERAFDDDIKAEFLFELPFFVVMPSHHRLSQQSQVRWLDLQDEPMITLQGPFTKHLLQDLPETLAQVLKQPQYEVNFLSTAFALTKQGLGLTLCLPYASERVSQQGLVMKQLINPVIKRRFFLYQRTHRTLSPAMMAFKKFLSGMYPVSSSHLK